MKDRFKYFFYSKYFIFLTAFSIGIMCHITASNQLLASDNSSNKVHSLANSTDHFEKIRKFEREQFSIFYDNQFDKDFNLNIGDDLDILLREDDNFKYVDIKSPNLDNLKIDINDGIIKIQSMIKRTKREEKKDVQIFSSYASSFSRAINVPESVDENKAEILKSEQGKSESVTIKFPKIKFTT